MYQREMMREQDIIEKIKDLLSEKRFRHTMGVAETAQQLAKRWNESVPKVRTAALLHDCARFMNTAEMVRFLEARSVKPDDLTIMAGASLLHAMVSKYLANEVYDIEDSDILSAIECHTMGKPDMSLLDKILFVSDYIEPGRDFEGVQVLRDLSMKDLDQTVVECVNSTVKYVLSENRLLHPKLLDCRNEILMKKMASNGVYSG